MKSLKWIPTLHLALSEENLEDITLPEKRNEWEAIHSQDCTDSFTANPTGNFFPSTCCSAQKKHDKGEPGLFKEEFTCSEMLCLCSKTYCCYDRKRNKYKFSSKGLNKRTLEDCGDGPMSKYRIVLEEAVNVTSTNRGFRTMKHSVSTYEQTKKGLSYFCPKRRVEDGIHTKTLGLKIFLCMCSCSFIHSSYLNLVVLYFLYILINFLNHYHNLFT